MYKKLDEEKLNTIISAGIEEFAEKGITGAKLESISKKAGVSVGVIYKYYEDKDALFLACVHYALQRLQNLLQDVIKNEDGFEESVKKIIHTSIESQESENQINKMYNTLTSRETASFSKELAKEIEGVSAKVYTDLIKKAQSEGKILSNANPAMFAFFFDSILMMIQFSFSCDYYKERIKLFCGENIFNEKEKLEEELSKFIFSAFGYQNK